MKTKFAIIALLNMFLSTTFATGPQCAALFPAETQNTWLSLSLIPTLYLPDTAAYIGRSGFGTGNLVRNNDNKRFTINPKTDRIDPSGLIVKSDPNDSNYFNVFKVSDKGIAILITYANGKAFQIDSKNHKILPSGFILTLVRNEPKKFYLIKITSENTAVTVVSDGKPLKISSTSKAGPKIINHPSGLVLISAPAKNEVFYVYRFSDEGVAEIVTTPIPGPLLFNPKEDRIISYNFVLKPAHNDPNHLFIYKIREIDNMATTVSSGVVSLLLNKTTDTLSESGLVTIHVGDEILTYQIGDLDTAKLISQIPQR